MEEESKLVAEKIEEGKYFSDALNWYSTRYIFVHTQFSQLLIVALLSIAAFTTAVFGYYSFLPVMEKKMFVTFIPINADERIRVKQLMDAGQDPDLALIKYFTQEYVRSREEYVIDKSERDFNFVSRLSGENVLQDYLTSISPDNPSSPYIVYANRGRRDIILRTARYYDMQGKPAIHHMVPKGRAEITFTAVENFGLQAQRSLDYVANIEFDYTKIIVDQETDRLTRKPEMVITNYSTKLNSGPSK